MEWAGRCSDRFRELAPVSQNLFGIVQGSVYPELRKESAERLIEIGFPGLCRWGARRRRTQYRHVRCNGAT